MSEDVFDEHELFSAFNSMDNSVENVPLFGRPKTAKCESTRSASPSELDSLKQENMFLKKVMRKIGFNTCKDEPIANILLYNDASSRATQADFEALLYSRMASMNCDVSGQSSLGKRRNMISDGFAAACDLISDHTKLECCEVNYHSSGLPNGCIQYFRSFCLDITGSDVEKMFPIPPDFDRVYIHTLPIETGSKRHQRRKQVCFNCDGDHKLNDCTRKRDLARISMKRKEFLEGRIDSRYHEDTRKMEQYRDLKPGKASEKLRKALGLADHDLPPFIYRMRMLGYPPSWLPANHDSGIVIHGGESNEEKKNESSHSDSDKLVHFPGFNVPIPSECKDLAYEVRLPAMQMKDQLNVKPEEYTSETESNKHRLPSEDYDSAHYKNKRMRVSSDNEMDVESEAEVNSSTIETVQPLNSTTGNPGNTSTMRQSSELEDGEIAESPSMGQTDMNCQTDMSCQTWWLKEPLLAHFRKDDQEFVPPPFPLTPMPLHKISQILPGELNHISAEDRSRWLDPVFGNLQVRTGRYDKLKIILASREGKRKSL